MSDLSNPGLPIHQPPPLSDGPPRTWWKRNWTWCLPLAMLLLVLALCGLAAAGYGILLKERRDSLPYSEAMRRVHCSPELAGKLGEPISDAIFGIWGHEGTQLGDMVVVANGLEGPQGAGRLLLRATRQPHGWTFDTLVVLVDDGSEVALERPKYADGGCPGMDGASEAGALDTNPRP